MTSAQTQHTSEVSEMNGRRNKKTYGLLVEWAVFNPFYPTLSDLPQKDCWRPWCTYERAVME